MDRYAVLPRSSENETWSEVSSRDACQKMSSLLSALTSRPASLSIVKHELKPFVIKDAAWNTEHQSLMQKILNVWELESDDDGVDTHELLQFYGLVLGVPPAVKLSFITTIGDKDVSWFIQRPNTQTWMSVQANIRPIESSDEQFARNLLYGDAPIGIPFFARCTSFSPEYVPPWGKRTLTASRRDELMNIINAGNVLGPRHDVTQRIIQQWIQSVRRRYRKKRTNPFDAATNDLG